MVRYPPGEPDLVRPDEPERETGKRMGAFPTAAMAVDGWKLPRQKVTKPSRMVVLG
ncbi:hypothetical protein [Lentzea indica]|uniref:hypothetical protein n=1 Tax=Lentzea indica TaxID=2604800 RepID=UPI0014395A03|nr:hypothetical protein [Lentzea indica]